MQMHPADILVVYSYRNVWRPENNSRLIRNVDYSCQLIVKARVISMSVVRDVYRIVRRIGLWHVLT